MGYVVVIPPQPPPSPRKPYTKEELESIKQLRKMIDAELALTYSPMTARSKAVALGLFAFFFILFIII